MINHKRFNLVRSVFFSNFKRLGSPYRVIFALTYRCNLRCKICRIYEKPPKEELGAGEIERIFRNLPGLSWLDMTGGEAMMREDLFEIAKAIIRSSPKLLIFHISTNGQFPRKVFLLVKEILKHGIIPVINISVLGPSGIDNELRGKQDSYSKSLETFELLRSLPRAYRYLTCTVSNYNILHINELLSEAKKDMPRFSFSNLHFNIFCNSSHYFENQDMDGLSEVKFDDIRGYVALARRGNLIKRFLEDTYLKGLRRYFAGNRFPLGCQALKSSFFINPYGEVYPCGFYERPIGNLKGCGYNPARLWDGEEASGIRKQIESGGCPGCWSPCESFPAMLGDIGGSLSLRRRYDES